MSLVGSLEDLGLGEILQIVSLSGKSGVLWIRSPHGEGRIVFDRGAIRGALVGDGPRDLRGLLLAAGAMPEADLDALHVDAQAEGARFEEILVARTALDTARLDELRERHVEASVLRMFSWPMGEFSFEVNDESQDPTGVDLLLRAGMNAQFLALEGTRLRDETIQGEDAPVAVTSSDAEDDAAMEIAFDGEEIALAESDGSVSEASDAPDGPAEMEITVLELVDGEIDEADTALLTEAIGDESPSPVVDDDPTLTGEAHQRAQADVAPASVPATQIELPSPPPAPAARTCTGIVIVDRDLVVLEWMKNSLAPLGLRAHIFPRSELAIQRIRQYFARGETPLVVLTSDTPPDSVSGARDWAEIAARLRAQVPQLPLLVVSSADSALSPANERSIPDAVATRPPLSVLADERAREKRDVFSEELRAAALQVLDRPGSRPAAAAARESSDPLRALREWSARLREPAPPSEVLRTVLEFANRHFDRAAIFWLRDGEAQAMAQVGMPATGGPDDAALRELCIATDGPECFRKVLASRAPVRIVPEEPGDLALCARLGRTPPPELYLGPVESGGEVAALLYADNAVAGRPLGDTTAIEVILHEGGLALDRAVLERALEEVESGRRPAGTTQGDAEA